MRVDIVQVCVMLLYCEERDGLCDVVECRDMPQWADYCARWAADGRCTNNPLLMATNCARTCNLCQTAQPATTATLPSSQHLTTTQQSTSLYHTHDGINATTTLKHETLTSSSMSTQSPVNVVTNSSLLTSVSVDDTLADNTVSNVSTQSISTVHNVHTDTLTASSALSTLFMSDVSKHDMTSLRHRVATANDTSVTSSYTDSDTSLRRASHSSQAASNSSERTTVVRHGTIDSGATDSSVTSANSTLHRPDYLATSTTMSQRHGHIATSAPADVPVHVTQLTDDMTSASVRVDSTNDTSVIQTVTSPYTDSLTFSMRASSLAASSISERTTVRRRRTIADSAAIDSNVTTARQPVVSMTSASSSSDRPSHLVTSAPVPLHVTQQTDNMTSASHTDDAAIHTSVIQTVTSPYTDVITSLRRASHRSLAAIDSSTTDDAGSGPHTTPSIPHTRTMSTSIDTDVTRHSQSQSTVQLSSSNVISAGSSIIISVNSSSSSSSSGSGSGSGSGGEVDLTSMPTVTTLPVATSAASVSSSLSNVTHDSSGSEQFSATHWSRDNASSPAVPTTMSATAVSTHSTLGPHYVTHHTTRRVLNTSSDTLTTILRVSASTHTTQSHQHNTTSSHGMLLSARVSSDETLAEPDSSPSSWSERVTSTASRQDTSHVKRDLSSVDNVFASHTSQVSVVNGTHQTPPPSTSHHHISSVITLNSSSNVTSRPVLDDFTEPSHDVMSLSPSTLSKPRSTEITAVPSFTANITHFTPVNISSNHSTHEVTDSLSAVLSTTVKMTNFTRGSSTQITSSINVADHQMYDTTTSAAHSSESTQSQLYVSKPHQSAASVSSTLPVTTSLSETTRSRPLSTITQDTATSVHVTAGRRHRPTTGRRATTGIRTPRGRLRSHAEHVVVDRASVTVDHPAR